MCGLVGFVTALVADQTFRGIFSLLHSTCTIVDTACTVGINSDSYCKYGLVTKSVMEWQLTTPRESKRAKPVCR